MRNYAMIINGKVIDIVRGVEEAPEWPPDRKGNPVTAIECDESVMIGMLYDGNTFTENVSPAPKPLDPEITLETIFKIVKMSQEEVANKAIDAYTEELIEGGLL